MSADSATSRYPFATPTALPLEAAFDGGRLTSDGGLPWLAEADAALGLWQTGTRGAPPGTGESDNQPIPRRCPAVTHE